VLDDAMVEVSAYILSSQTISTRIHCIDARSDSPLHPSNGFSSALLADPARTCLFALKSLQYLENVPFCYKTPPHLLRLFGSHTTIGELLGGLAKVGLATGDNERFVRCYWEVPCDSINRRWRWHAKGGDYLPFRPDVHLVVDWTDDGRLIEESFCWSQDSENGSVFPGRHHVFPPIFERIIVPSFAWRLHL
jgi:hypothetical protein